MNHFRRFAKRNEGRSLRLQVEIKGHTMFVTSILRGRIDSPRPRIPDFGYCASGVELHASVLMRRFGVAEEIKPHRPVIKLGEKDGRLRGVEP